MIGIIKYDWHEEIFPTVTSSIINARCSTPGLNRGLRSDNITNDKTGNVRITRITEARARNYCCGGKALSIT